MKALFCTHSGKNSGAINCLKFFLEASSGTGLVPVVATPTDGDLAQFCRQRGIAVEIADVRWWIAGESDVRRQMRRFASDLGGRVQRHRRMIEAHKPDVVVSNTSIIMEGALAAAACRVPHVYHVLEVLERDDDLHATVSIEAYCAVLGLLSDRVIAVSTIVADALRRGVPGEKLDVIPTGLRISDADPDVRAVRDRLGVSPDQPVILFAGVLSLRKGVVELGKAMRQVTDAVPDAVLLVAGPDIGAKGAMRAELTGAAGQAVRFLGPRRDVLELMAAADFVAVPSRVDPLPVVVLEAMNLGKAVVATASGGCSDMIEDGRTGLLVPVGDVDQLGGAITRLCRNAEERRSMGAAALDKVRKEFRPDIHAQAFSAALRQAAERGQPAARAQVVEPVVQFLTGLAGQRPVVTAFQQTEDQLRSAVRRLRGRLAAQRR
jgi:glycosyltransferase involved in cell wall biosynthesis